MATSNDIKKGMCIEFSNDIFKIIEFMHVKPGKGPAFVRTKMKSVTNGKVLDNTFSAGHKIDEVKVITRKFQYLYEDENGFHFMNNDDFTQIYIDKNMIENAQFMKAGEEVTLRDSFSSYWLPEGLVVGSKALVVDAPNDGSITVLQNGKEWRISDRCIDSNHEYELAQVLG